MGSAFKITELVRNGDDLVESGLRFEWSAAKRSAPINNWAAGLQQRTKRTDYPEGTQPSEQLLGHAFKVFTIHGSWDDRYNGAGFSDDTHRAIQQLLMRGNLCRFDQGTETITGIVIDYDWEYWRPDKIVYAIQVSPHFRNPKGDLVRDVKSPKSLDAPLDFLDDTDRAIERCKQAMASAPVQEMDSDLAAQVAVELAKLEARAGEVRAVLGTGRLVVLPATGEGPTGTSRLANAFSELASVGRGITALLRPESPDTALAFQTATTVLAFDVWARDTAREARALASRALDAAQEIAQRTTPATRALYRPRKGESLYGISLQVYNTASRARDIYLANNLNYMTLQGTELLLIPR